LGPDFRKELAEQTEIKQTPTLFVLKQKRYKEKKMKIFLAGGIVVGLLSAFSSVAETKKTPESRPATLPSKPALPSPVAEHCSGQGGVLIQKKRGDGAPYEVCIFEDDRQCEIYALIAGDCKKGGVSITGFNKQEQIYCAVLGGLNGDKQDTCSFKDGTLCEARVISASVRRRKTAGNYEQPLNRARPNDLENRILRPPPNHP
jgi:putative hemolysin